MKSEFPKMQLSKYKAYFTIKKEFVFIPFFFSFLLAFLWLSKQSLELLHFNRGIVSLPTLENIDIDLRISFFYKSILLAAFLFPLILVLLNFFSKKKIFSSLFLEVNNTFSFLGLLFLFLLLINSSPRESLQFFLIVQGLFSLLELSSRLIRDPGIRKKEIFIWIGILSFFIVFPVRQHAAYKSLPYSIQTFFLNYSIIVLLLWILVVLIRKIFKFSPGVIMRTAKPLALLPLLSFISKELYLVFNQRELFFGSPDLFYFTGVILIIISIPAIIIFGKKENIPKINRLLSRYYIPLFIIGLVVMSQYRPIIEQSVDTFELANPANAVMRTFVFGEVPIIDYITSHLISELIFPFIYTLFNGYDGTISFLIYEFFHWIIHMLIAYWVLLYIFRNFYVALFCVLFFPFVNFLFPFSLTIGLVSVILVHRLWVRYTYRLLILTFCWTVFLGIWKPEVGLSNLFIISIFLVAYLVKHFSPRLLMQYIYAFVIVAGALLVVLFSLASIQHTNLLVNFSQALSYFGANQAHGLPQLTPTQNRFYYFHYFIFPALVLSILLLKVFRGGNSRISLPGFALVFIAGLYFMNAQRGLVRHSFMEEKDLFMSSFLYLIIGIFSIQLIQRQTYRGFLFFVVSALIISFTKYPTTEGSESSFNKFIEEFINPEQIECKDERINRVAGSVEFSRERYAEFVNFLDTMLEDEDSFYDLSNTPMLYYYSGRKVPSYLNQIPNALTDRKMQEQNLSLIEPMSLPVVVFSHHPRTFWDKVDGVPNTLRHYVITRWIFDNFRPYAIINNQQIWIIKNRYEEFLEAKDQFITDSIMRETEIYDLKKLSRLMGTYTDESWRKSSTSVQETVIDEGSMIIPVPRATDISKLSWLNVSLSEIESNCNAQIQYSFEGKLQGSFHFEIERNFENQTYRIPLFTQYNWYSEMVDTLTLSFACNQNLLGKIKEINFSTD